MRTAGYFGRTSRGAGAAAPVIAALALLAAQGCKKGERRFALVKEKETATASKDRFTVTGEGFHPRYGSAKVKEKDSATVKESLANPREDFTPPPRPTGGQRAEANKPRPEPGKKPERPLQVWHRDARRPSFARVYVGDGNTLELVSLRVWVTIEGPRARTLVDHVFRNPHARQLEGTFEYPLPTGASPSYFAMFLGQTRDTAPPPFRRGGKPVALPEAALARLTPAEVADRVSTDDWGPLRVGRVVANDRALETYEEVVRGKVDPALLQYAGGNTFRGRVYPIAPRGYNRLLIAYEELLPATADGVHYRFPLPDCNLTQLRFALQADAAGVHDPTFQPGGARREESAGQLVYTRAWQGKGPGGEVRFTFRPSQPRVQAVSGRQGDAGPVYLYARLRPDVQVRQARPYSAYAVFLLDTSLSEQPDRFAVNMKLLRRILESDPDIKHFNVLTFDVAGRWLEPGGWLANTPEGRAQAGARLDGILLEGATDLSAALDKLGRPGLPLAPGTPLNVFLLSDGQITWGGADVASLAARFERRCPYPTRFHCYRIGLGAENEELFAALTRRGGGVFTCHGEADLAAAARAHRRQCLRVDRVSFAGGPAVRETLVAGRKAAVYPGGDLVVAGQAERPGKLHIVLEGTFQGRKVVQTFPVEVAGTGELAPRAWAEVAVATLAALNDPAVDDVITAYCQEFKIAGRVASFLVLENEADFKRLNLQEERGRTLAGGDLGRFVEEAWHRRARPLPPREALAGLLARSAGRLGLGRGGTGGELERLLALLNDADLELPFPPLEDQCILHEADVSPLYLKERARDRADPGPYVAEARRRADRNQAAAAVRALSSVVEENPGRADALRLVGYRLLDLGQPAQAARLFHQVLAGRPFEPHSYRDLARSLEDCRQFGLAALYYEMVLAGSWDDRFVSLPEVVREEYAHLLKEALRNRRLRNGPLAQFLSRRLAQLARDLSPTDLRVTISWNTDATDVDLWVIEPDGTKCFYARPRTPGGGELSGDQTRGYGPERYQVKRARPGVYRVLVHYYSANPDLLGGQTHVNVLVTRHAGTPQEMSERHTVTLKRPDEAVRVCEVKF